MESTLFRGRPKICWEKNPHGYCECAGLWSLDFQAPLCFGCYHLQPPDLQDGLVAHFVRQKEVAVA